MADHNKPSDQDPRTDGEAGSEHEMCSVYAARSDAPVSVNPNEISACRPVAPDTLDTALAAHPERYTPWLKMDWPRIRAAFSAPADGIGYKTRGESPCALDSSWDVRRSSSASFPSPRPSRAWPWWRSPTAGSAAPTCTPTRGGTRIPRNSAATSGRVA